MNEWRINLLEKSYSLVSLGRTVVGNVATWFRTEEVTLPLQLSGSAVGRAIFPSDFIERFEREQNREPNSQYRALRARFACEPSGAGSSALQVTEFLVEKSRILELIPRLLPASPPRFLSRCLRDKSVNRGLGKSSNNRMAASRSKYAALVFA